MPFSDPGYPRRLLRLLKLPNCWEKRGWQALLRRGGAACWSPRDLRGKVGLLSSKSSIFLKISDFEYIRGGIVTYNGDIGVKLRFSRCWTESNLQNRLLGLKLILVDSHDQLNRQAMVYLGKPSTGCRNCRQRRIKVSIEREAWWVDRVLEEFKADYPSAMKPDPAAGHAQEQTGPVLGIQIHLIWFIGIIVLL